MPFLVERARPRVRRSARSAPYKCFVTVPAPHTIPRPSGPTYTHTAEHARVARDRNDRDAHDFLMGDKTGTVINAG